MRQTEKPGIEQSIVKGLGLNDFASNGNPSVIDVKDGKLVRIRPLHFDWKYDKKSLKSMENGVPRAGL